MDQYSNNLGKNGHILMRADKFCYNFAAHMKQYLIFTLLLIGLSAYSQDIVTHKKSNKGDFYIYWGWNLDSFSNSDIHFEGANYNFTLYNVVANGRQSHFGFDPYFEPTKVTIPQYNFRIGYFISDHFDISIGVDHMKYVMLSNQTVKINGYIVDSKNHDGVYVDDNIKLTRDFLQYEHTDGLNYINAELRRTDHLLKFSFLDISFTSGLGAGALIPRTNATLLDYDRHDEFHLAGYGLDALIGIRIKIYKSLFLQTEFKVGYINMPDIRTTYNIVDKASQDFFFAQNNFLFGFKF